MTAGTARPRKALRVAGLVLLLGFLLFGAQTGQEAAFEDLLKVKISTVSKYEQLAREAPASITIIGQEEIHRFGYLTLHDVLSSVPGFYMSYDRNYSYLGVRGYGRPTDYNNRILLLVNGLQINQGIWSQGVARRVDSK